MESLPSSKTNDSRKRDRFAKRNGVAGTTEPTNQPILATTMDDKKESK